MPWTEANFAVATAALDAAESVLVVTHVAPDGDAIGSTLGLLGALRARGLRVEAAVDDGVPSFLHFLEGFDFIAGGLSTGAWDVMISVDASDEARTGKVGAYGRANTRTVINLDHHATNTGFGDIHLVNPDAASACEIVYAWLMAMGAPLTPPIARALLTGIVTDTLGFRTSSVTPQTLSAAQALIAAGASLAEVAARTLDSRPFVTLNIWRYALQSVQLADGVIYATISQDDLRRANAEDNSDVGLSSFLVQTNEARVSAVFKETPEGAVELSMRAKLGYDVSGVAFGLGGGGHKQASGATIPGPLEAAVAQVLPLLGDAVRAGQPVYS
jgi:phosphoesterase RecJ-like protein